MQEVKRQYGGIISMQIKQEQTAEKRTLHVEGRIDTTTAPSLEAVINGMDAGVKELVLDLENVDYISSAGLRVLLTTQKKMSKVGAFILTGVRGEVMEVFDMTGFSNILDIR